MIDTLRINIESDFNHLQLNVDTEIELKGIIGLFGHSGSGKTSLLKSIAGLNRNLSGKIAINNHILYDSINRIELPTEQRGIVGVFQQDGLFPHLTVLGNLQYATKRRSHTQLSLTEIIDDTGIEPLLTQHIASLSGGERQKVAIARALLAQPKLLILDEPVTALDRNNKANILSLIKKLQSRYQIPIFYVSHSIEEIQALADSLIVMEQGKITMSGNVHKIIHRLNSGQLIEPLTSLNLIRTASDNEFGLTQLQLDAGSSIYAMSQHLQHNEKTTLRCYVLARDISICTSKPDDSSIVNQLAGTITDIKITSHSVLITVNCSDQFFYTNISTYSLDKLALTKGKAIFLQFKASAVRQIIN